MCPNIYSFYIILRLTEFVYFPAKEVDKINHLIHTMKMSHDIVVVFWLTKGRKFMTWMSWVVLFPLRYCRCCVACNRSLKIRAWPRKKKLTNFSLLACSSKTNVLIDLIEFCEKKKMRRGQQLSSTSHKNFTPYGVSLGGGYTFQKACNNFIKWPFQQNL